MGRKGRRGKPPFGSRELNHPVSDIKPDDACATCRGGEGDVARAGGQVEDAVAGANRRESNQPPLPPPILPVRQRDGDEIVAIRDCRKQRAHVGAFAMRSGELIVKRQSRR